MQGEMDVVMLNNNMNGSLKRSNSGYTSIIVHQVVILDARINIFQGYISIL